MKHTQTHRQKKNNKKKTKKLDNIYVFVYRIPKTYSNGEKIRLKQGFNKTNALIMKATFHKRLNFKILHGFMLLQ